MTLRKRGVELSLNTVLLVALGLIVLTILVYLVMRGTSGTTKDIQSCLAKGGHCISSPPCPEGEVGSKFFTDDCPNENDICCRKPF